jgi:hypothetical protein
MLTTTDKRESELIQEKEGQRVTAGRVESGLACITLNRRMTMEIVCWLLEGLCRRHTGVVNSDFMPTRVSHGNQMASRSAHNSVEREYSDRKHMQSSGGATFSRV